MTRHEITCPNCHASHDNKVIWGLRNLGAVLGNIGFYALQVLLMVPLGDGFALRRKCLKCGFRFLGPRPEAPDFDVCTKCDYNLTGNTSGRCPECGWKLPRRFRAHRRLVDRAPSDKRRDEG